MDGPSTHFDPSATPQPGGLKPPTDLPTSLADLRASGWESVSVAEEMRRNTAKTIAAGASLVPGVLGFEETVVPQLENAILAGHDMILLGERGQAKTRVIRSMVGLLDEWTPIVAGSEINDDPYNPVSRYALDRVEELGEATPIDWVHRSQRYGEKLATPDTSIADLIGEVDPIKIAEGRYLSDELALHYGLIPRVNRGIFAINELPDLSERIQVGLLNILEERDVQIRGHRIRLPLDIMLVATANPEDYTNRGRIITPLKDRFGAQIRTHYPFETMTEVRIMEGEADLPTAGVPVSVPAYMKEIIAEISQLARRSTHLNQRSGVSVRLSIANYETLVASAARRALRTGEPVAVPRISDLSSLVPSTQGKIEVEAMEEGHEDEVVAQLVAAATLSVFRRRVTLDDPQSIVAAFHDQLVVHVGDDLPSSAYLAVLAEMPELEPPTRKLAGPEAAEAESPALMASSLEFLLEGLHLTKRLNKDASGARALSRTKVGTVGEDGIWSMSGVAYDYSEWDGTQEFADLDPDDLLAGLTDDLLAGGDLDDALRRLLRSGFRTADGDQVAGLRDLLDQLRRRRQEMLAEGDPDGRMAELTRQLDDIEQDERAAIDELVDEAATSGDERRREVTDDVATERRMALDLQPDDPAGRIGSLQHYDFVSSEAREKFEELVEELRREMADTFFEGASDALSNMSPEQMQRMRDAYDALNHMLEQRERGEDLDPSFEEFMAEFGDMFPGNPQSLDELLEQLAERMAAAQAVWNSLSPEQQAQLSQLMEAVLEDMDLRWQVERLAQNLQRAFPDAGWQESYDFNGEGSMPLNRATDLATQLGQLDRMEEVLQSASTPAALGEIDLDQVKRHMGEDAARALDRLANLTKSLADAGLIEHQGGRIELTPLGVRRLGQKALADLFGQINKDRIGDHSTVLTGSGHDREETTKAYEYGDPLNLHLSTTVHNAVRRGGSGVPVRLTPEDFEVVEVEALSRSATVLCVDLSMSMPMRDNFVPAKRMAMALQTLISSKFPRDYLGIIGFSEVAREIRPDEIPTAMWDYVYGTNLQHALALSRRLLAHQHGTKQIIVVTDGEPTAHIDDFGEVTFNYPPIPETLRRTMAEVIRCTRAGIVINTFALDLQRTHYPFVEQIARVNGGRTFYTTPDALGGYVLVDFLQHRRVLRPAG